MRYYLPVLILLLSLSPLAARDFSFGSDPEHKTAASIPEPQVATPQLKAEDTPFSKLAVMFDNGTVPETQSLTGWHTGRLYLARDPENAIGVLLAGNWTQPSALSGNRVLELRRLEKENLHFFDLLDNAKREEIGAALVEHTQVPQVYTGRNCFYVLGANGRKGDKMFIRQLGENVVFQGYSAETRELFYGYVTRQAR